MKSVILASLFVLLLGIAYFAFTQPTNIETADKLPPTESGAGSLPDLLTGHMQNFVLSTDGQQAPDFAFSDGDGNRLTFADFRGKILVLNIWATWCGPCRREMKSLQNLQRRFGDDITVLPLSIDRDGAGPVREFYEEYGIDDLGIFLDPGGTNTRALTIGVPATFVYDREGRGLGFLLGPAEWASDDAIALISAFVDR